MSVFDEINNRIKDNAVQYLLQWFPEGKVQGTQFNIGNLSGDPGKSLTVNIPTGKWIDHANPEDKGGDYFSLFMARHNLSKGEAVNQLKREILGDYGDYEKKSPPPQKEKPQDYERNLNLFNKLKIKYEYRDAQGKLLFWVGRAKQNGVKKFFPFHDDEKGRKVNKLIKGARPLYMLPQVIKSDSILLVEGEKCVHAAMSTGWRNPQDMSCL